MSLALFLMFFVPLAIESIIRFPGPIPKYLSYGSNSEGNRIVESLGFLGAYWGQGPIVLMLWGVLFGFLVVCASGEEYFFDLTGILFALLIATAGVFFYAKVGIDSLSFKYLGLFYFSVPAIALATAAYCLYQKFAFKRKLLLAIASILVGLGFIYCKIKRPTEYSAQYNQAEIPVLFDSIRHLGTLPLVLDLSSKGSVWPTIVGVEAYAKRMKVPLFCINQNWHVLFTEEAKCTDSQIREGRRFVVSQSDPSSAGAPKPSLDFLGLSFYPFDLPLISSRPRSP
jgi:hypothetical protein